MIRCGLPASTIDVVAKLLSLSRAALLAAIKIPPSTIERRLRTGEALSADESDRVSRVAKVLGRTVEVFGAEIEGKAWMTDSISSLGGRTPLSLLDTIEGYELWSLRPCRESSTESTVECNPVAHCPGDT